MSRNENFAAGYLHEVRDFDGEPHHLAGWHMTDKSNFKANPKYTPEDTVGAGADRGSLFYTQNPVNWGPRRFGRTHAVEVWAKGKTQGLDLVHHEMYEGMDYKRSGQFRTGAVMPAEEAQKHSPIVETGGRYGGANHVLSALHYSAKNRGAAVTMIRGGEEKSVRYRRAVK